jgi:hypothetical protein
MAEREEIGRVAGLDDQSKTRAGATAIGASAIFGPVGLLIGAGVGLLSKRLHKSQLDIAVSQYNADLETAEKVSQLFAQDMEFDRELYDDARVTDIDRRQHAMIDSRMQRAQVLLQHPDPQVRAQGLQLMNQAAEQREVWLEDIETRAEKVGDDERNRAWKLEDDIAQLERDVYKQSLGHEQQFAMQAEKERIATERGLLMDNLATVKDSYRGKSAAIRDTDAVLATIEQESYIDQRTGQRVLTQAGRAALEAAVELRMTSGPIAQTLQEAGRAGRGSEIAAIAQFLGKAAATFTSYVTGENVSDAELLELLEAMDRAGEEHYDNIIENTKPAIRAQAERAGADPATATAGVTFELTERQRKWREQYRQSWDTDRNRTLRTRQTPPQDPAAREGRIRRETN